MKINLKFFDQNNNIVKTPNPVWFEHLICDQGTKREFKFTFADQISPQIQQIKIQFDDEPAQLFNVSIIEKNYQHKKRFFSLTASHPLNLITQNNLPPQNWENFSLQTLFEQFCQPFQIKNIKTNLQTTQTINFYTTLGMTNWDAIKLFFRKQLNCSVFIDKNNSITTKFIPAQPIIFNANDPYLTKIEHIENRDKLFSTILVQKFDDDPNIFSMLKIQNPSIQQNNVNKIKFFKVPSQYALMPNRGAQAIFDRINAKHKIMKLKFKKTMQPIYPGTIIKFKDNNKTINMCVTSFATSITKEGSSTEIAMAYADLVV